MVQTLVYLSVGLVLSQSSALAHAMALPGRGDGKDTGYVLPRGSGDGKDTGSALMGREDGKDTGNVLSALYDETTYVTV